MVLGTMQDGGLPHIGCRCARCAAARADQRLSRLVACLALIDWRWPAPAVWLIDATPDIGRQLDLLGEALGPHPQRPERLRQPDGIFLTHAHLGHIGGIPQLGPEAMAAENLPVYGTAALLSLLKENALWRPAVSALALTTIEPHTPIQLGKGLVVTAVPVPHRDEWGAGTVAYQIDGLRRSLLYVPDIDDWGQWPQAEAKIAAVDMALLDASFYSTRELDGRQLPVHPLVPDTLQRFGRLSTRLILTHFNHTNPLLDADSPEREAVEKAGIEVAAEGMVLAL